MGFGEAATLEGYDTSGSDTCTNEESPPLCSLAARFEREDCWLSEDLLLLASELR